jgi:aminodeoxyfutalosine synthase
MAAVLEHPVSGYVRSPALADARLEPIAQKVARGGRLTLDDGDVLYTTRDIWTVCRLADSVRRRLHGDVAYYNINRHLNYSNVCALSCKFCEFYRKQGDDGSYTRDMQYVRQQAREAVEGGATEIHSVGGLHPHLPFEYYTDLCRTIRATAQEMGSDLHVKAFTAVEIVHLARIAKMYKVDDPASGIRWVLEQLKAAGLGSLPGGGAEVFDDRVHDEAFKGKIRSDVWLLVHKVAHELGLNTNATILYGHIEDRRERLVHMDMLRQAQDEALARITQQPSVQGPMPNAFGSFQAIIPLPFFPDGCDLEHLPGPSGLENLRTLAIARLMLDNFPHVKAFWIMQTLPMAQLMLQCGADDIDGTVVWYDITKVAQGGGAQSHGTHQEVNTWTLQKAIREAGFEPVERDTLYRKVRRDGRAWSV